ncbi:MAG: pyrroloquinoline quinone biosynthesis protein PqqB [Hyphomicrobiales bacterium]
MRIVVLGSAAGGGFPQWNCRCAVCDLFWSGDPRVRRRTQSSLAVTGDGRDWVLLNASPDIREQIGATPALRPRSLRDSPMRSVVVSNGDVDHIGGLISLRESAPFTVHATPEIHAILKANSVFDVLNSESVQRSPISLDMPFDAGCGLTVTAFSVPGKVPLFLEQGAALKTDERSGNTIGLEIRDAGGKCCFYVPGCADIDAELSRRIKDAPLVFFDGTVWTDTEMADRGVGTKTGRRMGHLPVSGPDGSLARLKALGVKKVVYVHINNTNPMLVEGSPEAAAVASAGFAVGFDGMKISP